MTKFLGKELKYNSNNVWHEGNFVPSDKVDKVTGKQLSTNDYTTTEKNKLAGIATGANNYVHPSGTNPHGTTKADVGLGSVLNYGIATQSEAEVGTSNIKYMTPLRVVQAISKFTSSLTGAKITIGKTQPSNGMWYEEI